MSRTAAKPPVPTRPTTRLASTAAGIAAGVLGAVAMSPVMSRTATRRLPRRYRLRDFPPRMVVSELGDSVIPGGRLPRRVERALTWPAHLAYGAAVGAAYGLARTDSDPVARGTAFGLAVWVGGYAGWLPVLGVRESTVAGPPRKIPIPLAAHVVFGITTALVHRTLLRRQTRNPNPRAR